MNHQLTIQDFAVMKAVLDKVTVTGGILQSGDELMPVGVLYQKIKLNIEEIRQQQQQQQKQQQNAARPPLPPVAEEEEKKQKR